LCYIVLVSIVISHGSSSSLHSLRCPLPPSRSSLNVNARLLSLRLRGLHTVAECTPPVPGLLANIPVQSGLHSYASYRLFLYFGFHLCGFGFCCFFFLSFSSRRRFFSQLCFGALNALPPMRPAGITYATFPMSRTPVENPGSSPVLRPFLPSPSTSDSSPLQ